MGGADFSNENANVQSQSQSSVENSLESLSKIEIQELKKKSNNNIVLLGSTSHSLLLLLLLLLCLISFLFLLLGFFKIYFVKYQISLSFFLFF
jgi:hypothetical protein